MRSVTIGKVRYRVRVVKDAQRHRARYAKVDSPDALHGYISPARREIVIEEGPPEQMATTVLHEMIHALAVYLDEDAVRSIEEGLFPVLWRHGFRPF